MKCTTLMVGISRSELVLHGTILNVVARFTPDESLIFTEYTISPIRIFKQQWSLSTAPAPGQSAPIIVRHLEGTIMEGEQRFSTSADLYPPAEHFQRGEQAVLFLVHNDETGAYNLTYGPFGAFPVVKGHAIPMTKKVAQRRGDVARPLAAFLEELDQRTRLDK